MRPIQSRLVSTSLQQIGFLLHRRVEGVANQELQFKCRTWTLEWIRLAQTAAAEFGMCVLLDEKEIGAGVDYLWSE